MNVNVYLKQNVRMKILVIGILIDFFMKISIMVIYQFHINVIQDYEENIPMIII
jgi:hypothetical protein